MADSLLESGAISAFCNSMATMLAAGIQTDEAVRMLSEDREQSHFTRVCEAVYSNVVKGSKLSEAMIQSGAFPKFATDMVQAGEVTGRTERVLQSLANYYETEDKSVAKLSNSVGYPAALLCVMSVILVFTVLVILPVFTDAYSNISGSLTSGSFSMVGVSMVVGWVSLAIVLVATIFALTLTMRIRTESGRIRVMASLRKFPSTKKAMYQLALANFTSTLASFLASGMHEEEAMDRALKTVEHEQLHEKGEAALTQMRNLSKPVTLSQAIVDNEIFEPIYGRMLLVGTRSGSTDTVLEQLSNVFFEDSIVQIDSFIDSIEPAFAAFLTIAVGATLIAVMLPLIGIMGSIA